MESYYYLQSRARWNGTLAMGGPGGEFRAHLRSNQPSNTSNPPPPPIGIPQIRTSAHVSSIRASCGGGFWIQDHKHLHPPDIPTSPDPPLNLGNLLPSILNSVVSPPSASPSIPFGARIPHSHVSHPLPPLPADPFTKDQWTTLLALGDTIVASLEPASPANAASTTVLPIPQDEYSASVATAKRFAAADADPKNIEAWMREKPSENEELKLQLWRFLGSYTPEDLRKQFKLVLTLLNYRAGTLVLGGYATSFADLPLSSRHAILLSWQKSRIPMLRQLLKSMSMIFKQLAAKTSPSLYNLIGFPRIPVHGEPVPGFDFKFMQFPPVTGVYVGKGPAPEPEEVLETDVVVVGSGCGGGVSAKNIAEMGLRVIVTEKWYHWPSEHMPMNETDGMVHMFMDGGGIVADDSDLIVLAGATWGGGGTINWSASLQTQGYVRKEWAEKDKLPFFTSAAFQTSLDRICERMGVSDKFIEHNHANRAVLDGARKLGWAHKPVPQNTAGKQHYCGYCTLGCGACVKQGPANSFLPDAANAGAQFIEGFDAREIVFEKALKNGKRVVSGVRGVWTSRDENGGVAGAQRTVRKVFIKAKRVIVSAGTMQSPLLLLRSGLKNKNIGRHLKAHPVNVVGLIYDQETRPWEGGILTSVVNEFENLDGHGHGAKIETAVMLPSTFLTFPVWRDAVDWKRLATKTRHAASMFAMARDIGEGYVYPDPVDGRTRFHYHVHPRDRAHILEGLCGIIKLAYITGAREIIPGIPSIPPFVRAGPIPASSSSSTYNNPYPAPRDPAHPPPPAHPESDYPHAPSTLDDAGVNDPALLAYLALIRKTGLSYPDVQFVSAHQMGTCRMGASPNVSVVDPTGAVWGTDGVYVADASVFPSASGVNPMVTNMAISDWPFLDYGRPNFGISCCSPSGRKIGAFGHVNYAPASPLSRITFDVRLSSSQPMPIKTVMPSGTHYPHRRSSMEAQYRVISPRSTRVSLVTSLFQFI
ncbi:hypothetical protein P152DRAFT_449983 [Eremomyces bilateralis CBS 781.70]|uniref:Long-chain-alcohol oxidase n=1 Tax=Eremomyces bilateralis CBS 781.70 TaxID=1392243 RepID=A0A6G1G1M6_9PEZI|nr:uncharacterized protein P152DRAFT_449983 [Eremomyces bilateralis CBS 781.70]KAF1811709.1 hypothetical protein P152DRAFT_449983 [Eremomyces bilateralis CBS 781.70]